jgi:hypothetical protein
MYFLPWFLSYKLSHVPFPSEIYGSVYSLPLTWHFPPCHIRKCAYTPHAFLPLILPSLATIYTFFPIFLFFHIFSANYSSISYFAPKWHRRNPPPPGYGIHWDVVIQGHIVQKLWTGRYVSDRLSSIHSRLPSDQVPVYPRKVRITSRTRNKSQNP